jgi:hypothetical protein
LAGNEAGLVVAFMLTRIAEFQGTFYGTMVRRNPITIREGMSHPTTELRYDRCGLYR